MGGRKAPHQRDKTQKERRTGLHHKALWTTFHCTILYHSRLSNLTYPLLATKLIRLANYYDGLLRRLS